MKRGRPIERSDPQEDKQRARASVVTNVFAFFVVVGSIRIGKLT